MARMTAENSRTAAYMTAYRVVSSFYGLKAKQRDLLDASDLYTNILDAVADDQMGAAGQLLIDAGIIGLTQLLDAADRNLVISEITLY